MRAGNGLGRSPWTKQPSARERDLRKRASSLGLASLGAKGFAPIRRRRRFQFRIERLQDFRRLFLSPFRGLDRRRASPGGLHRGAGKADRKSASRDTARTERSADSNSILRLFKDLQAGKVSLAPPSRPTLLSVGAHGRARVRLPHLVASRVPSPYHFRAQIQSFQLVAAPFPGDAVLPSGSLATRWSRPKSDEPVHRLDTPLPRQRSSLR